MNSFSQGFLSLIEKKYIVGRDKQLNDLLKILDKDQDGITSVYGDAGIGKTTLLNVFMQIAIKKYNRKPYFFDCRANEQINWNKINDVFADEKSVIVIDTFEQSSNFLKKEISTELIPKLHGKIPLIIGGRKPMELSESRYYIQKIGLRPLDYEDVLRFFIDQGLPQQFSKMAYHLSGGNPFVLNLFAWALNLGGIEVVKKWIQKGEMDRKFIHMVMMEVGKEELLEILESTSVINTFDFDLLNFLHNNKLNEELFQELVNLSFITRTVESWHIHELVGRSIRSVLKQESPERFYTYKKRAFEYYTQKSKQVDNETAYKLLLDRMYLCENEIARDAMFFDPFKTTGKYELDITKAKDEELQELLMIWMLSCKRTMGVSRQQIDLAFWDTLELFRIGREYIRVIKDADSKIKAYHLTFPVCDKTISYFKNSPAYKQYYSKLPSHEKLFLKNANSNSTDTYAIRHFVLLNLKDVGARSLLFKNVTRIVLPGRRIVTSIPNDYFQKVVEGLGFQILPSVYDTSFDVNMPVAVLDFRNIDVDVWLRWLTLKDDVYPWLTNLIKKPKIYWQQEIKTALNNINNYKKIGELPLASLAIALTRGTKTLTSTITPEQIGRECNKLIVNTIKELENQKDDPSISRMGEVLRVTYLEDCSSREEAAERLKLSLSSYYRWLKKSIHYLTDMFFESANSVFKQ